MTATDTIRQAIAEMTGFPIAAVSSNASTRRFAIDRSVVDGAKLQAGLAAMARELAADGVGLFHVRSNGPTRPEVRIGTWQHYTMRKTA